MPGLASNSASNPSMQYLPIAGTWGREHDRNRSPGDPTDWFKHGSAVDRVMAACGHARVDQDRDPDTPDKGFWSGDIGGTLTQRLWPWSDHLDAWRSGGERFQEFCIDRQDDFQDGLVILTHSHGGHVLVMALNLRPLPFPIHVIDIDMPVQRPFRMPRRYYDQALERVESWTHVFSDRGWDSRFRWLGNAFGPRELEGAYNVGPVTGGHSGILNGGFWHLAQLDVIVQRGIR